jgi:hypothetical protein
MTGQPPHDLGAEQAVLGALLSGAALTDAGPLASADFYAPRHQLIFEAIVALDDGGKPRDPVAVLDELRRRRQITKMNGGPYLHTCIEACPVVVSVGYYAGIVREQAERRRIIENLTRALQAAADPGTSLDDVRSMRSDTSDTSPGYVRGGASLLTGRRDGAWLGVQEFAPLRYHVPGIIAEGVTVLAGAPKVGKSWLVLGCGLAVAGPGAALGKLWCNEPRPVFYLALEDGDRRMQDRCRILLDGKYRPRGSAEIPARFTYLTRVRPGAIVATISEYLDACGKLEPLVIIDTLGRVLPPADYGETAYGRDYRIMTDLKDLADAWPGTSLLISHHDRKAESPDFVAAISGTNGIAGGADTVLLLTRPRGESSGLLHVTGRDVTEDSYAVSFDQGAWTLDGAGLAEAAGAARTRQATSGLAERSAEIVAFVIGRDEPVSPAEVGKALSLNGDQAGKYLRRAAETGRLTKTGRGLYTPRRSVRMSESGAAGDAGQPDRTVAEQGELPPDPGDTDDVPPEW